MHTQKVCIILCSLATLYIWLHFSDPALSALFVLLLFKKRKNGYFEIWRFEFDSRKILFKEKFFVLFSFGFLKYSCFDCFWIISSTSDNPDQEISRHFKREWVLLENFYLTVSQHIAFLLNNFSLQNSSWILCKTELLRSINWFQIQEVQCRKIAC